MTNLVVFEEAVTLLGSRMNADFYDDLHIISKLEMSYGGTVGSVVVAVERS